MRENMGQNKVKNPQLWGHGVIMDHGGHHKVFATPVVLYFLIFLG